MRKSFPLLFIFVLILIMLTYIMAWIGFPADFQLIKGQEENLEILFPFHIYLQREGGEGLLINGQEVSEELIPLEAGEPMTIKADSPGELNVRFLLFGVIPLRNLVVRVLPPISVVPGGQSIGVLLQQEGVIVRDHHLVLDKSRRPVYPAREAGIEIGDTILEINGEQITSQYQVGQLLREIGEAGSRAELLLKRSEGKRELLEVEPLQDYDSGRYMLGIRIDDGAQGVGTLTFYHPETECYGALGHMVTDLYTRQAVDLSGGVIVEADITGINTGQDGMPGEKMGVFLEEGEVLGNIEKNTSYGIFGSLEELPQISYFHQPLSVATGIQVKPGPAQIYTVIEGGEVQEFKVEIERVRRQGSPSSKGLVIRIVDQGLLEKTGGIVQGMSGSPIVQEGALVGAVTHVFIQDPTRGYGVLAEWMMMESGLLEELETDLEGEYPVLPYDPLIEKNII